MESGGRGGARKRVKRGGLRTRKGHWGADARAKMVCECQRKGKPLPPAPPSPEESWHAWECDRSYCERQSHFIAACHYRSTAFFDSPRFGSVLPIHVRVAVPGFACRAERRVPQPDEDRFHSCAERGLCKCLRPQSVQQSRRLFLELPHKMVVHPKASIASSHSTFDGRSTPVLRGFGQHQRQLTQRTSLIVLQLAAGELRQAVPPIGPGTFNALAPEESSQRRSTNKRVLVSQLFFDRLRDRFFRGFACLLPSRSSRLRVQAFFTALLDESVGSPPCRSGLYGLCVAEALPAGRASVFSV